MVTIPATDGVAPVPDEAWPDTRSLAQGLKLFEAELRNVSVSGTVPPLDRLKLVCLWARNPESQNPV